MATIKQPTRVAAPAPSSLEGWLARYKGQAATAMNTYTAASKEAARQMSIFKSPHATTAAKAKATIARNKQLAIMTAQTKARGTALTNQADTQNKIYVKNGQYDKLLSGTERDAFMAVQALFKTYGLDSLAGKIYDYTKNGYSPDTVSILLQDSPEYKARFVGNAARVKAGLPVLSPAEYLSTESSYKQIMQAAGMPLGFYDQPGDFASWIGKDVSPTEVQSRVDLATQATTLANPDYKKALNQMGISDATITAHFLDQTKALPFLQKEASTAAIGAQALHQGLGFDQGYAGQLATEGITAQQAQQGYSQIGVELPQLTQLGNIYGEQWGQRQSEQAVFEGSASALSQEQRLVSREKGSFSGNVGAAAARGGLSQGGGAA